MRLGQIEAPITAGELTRLRVRGKGDKERVVWLTEALWETLQEWLRARPTVETDHLFLNHKGGPINVAGIQYRLNSTVKQLK